MSEMIEIPRPTLERLPRYYRCLCLARERDQKTISSDEIGREVGVNVVQVRKDLAYFGEFGRPGVGYNVETLMRELERLLGLETPNEAVLVGAGRLGTAIASYQGFGRYRLRIVALFDNDPQRIGARVGDSQVFSLDKLPHIVRRLGIELGIICVPREPAQATAELLVDNGVKAIWNFAPTTLKLPKEIAVRNEDLAVGLATLCHHLNKDQLDLRKK